MDVHFDVSRILQRTSHVSDQFGPHRVHALLHALAVDNWLVLGAYERVHVLSKLSTATVHTKSIHRLALSDNLALVLHEICFCGMHAPFGRHFLAPPLLYFYHIVRTFAAALQMCGCPVRVAEAFTREMLDIPVNHAFALGWESLEAVDYAYLFTAQTDMFFVVTCFFAEKVVAGVDAFRAAWPYVSRFHARFVPAAHPKFSSAERLHVFLKNKSYAARTVVAMMVRVYYHYEQSQHGCPVFTPECGDLAMALFSADTLAGVMACITDVRASTRGVHKKNFVDASLRHLHHVLTCSTGVDSRFCAWVRLEVLREALQRCLR
jgi:hypothetical protein